MKKIFVLGLITVLSLTAVSYIYADAGEEEASNVAPAMIQVPREPVEQQPAPAPRPAAQTGRRTIRETDLRTDCQESVTGTVSCIVPSSLMQPRAKLVIADQGGNEIEFTIKTLAVIYDTAGNILSFDSLQQGMKIRVNYRALSGGCKEATAIKVLK